MANCTVHALLMEVFAFLPFSEKKGPQSPSRYCVGVVSQAISSKQEHFHCCRPIHSDVSSVAIYMAVL